MITEQQKIESVIAAVCVELKTYMAIAETYAEENCHCEEVRHLSLITNKMSQQVDKLWQLYDNNRLKNFI